MTDASTSARYAAVWRWHFYAGMLCIPFVIWLALTGSIYLWRPQIEGWFDRRFDHLPTQGAVASPEAQVAAALRAVPGSRLHKYVLPQAPDAAVRVLVAKAGSDRRALVDPRSLAVLAVQTEEARPMRLLFHLHGELLAGAVGSYVVEIAACWAIVMLLTGLYLWWPRGRPGLAGILYPRLRGGGRRFWRDLHASTGIWVAAAALGLILTGLPWAKGWGSYLTDVRAATGSQRGAADWTIGGKPPAADPMLGEHAGHGGFTMSMGVPRPGELDRVVATVRALDVAPPVLISPPAHPGLAWSVASDAADRPLRSDLKVDGATGRLVSRTDFAQRHWIDRTIGYGVAVHEGQLFGVANQLFGTLTALLLVLLAVSGAVMWWKRRPVGLLGAPLPRGRARFGPAMAAAIVLLALYLPLFGLTLLLVLAFDRSATRLFPRASRWLELATPAAAAA